MNSLRHLFVLSLSMLLPAAFAAPAVAADQHFTLDPDHTQVRVTWSHLGFSHPGASFNVGEGTVVWNPDDASRISVQVDIPVASVHTQVPALNQSFKTDYFAAAEHPMISFRSTGVEQVGISNRYRVHGELTVRGVTRPVTLDATLNKVGQHPMLQLPALGFDATATVRRTDFGIDVFVPAVSDQVRIRITGEAIGSKPAAQAD